MTIELAPVPVAPKAAAKAKANTEANASKTKPAESAEAAPAKAKSKFVDILASLGAGLTQVPDAQQALPVIAEVPVDQDLAGTLMDPMALLSQSLMLKPPAADGVANANLNQLPGVEPSLLVPSLATQPGAGGGANSAALGHLNRGAAAKGAPGVGFDSLSSQMPVVDAATLSARKSAQAQTDTASLQSAMETSNTNQSGESGKPDSRIFSAIQTEISMKPLTPAAEATLAVISGSAKREEQKSDRMIFKPLVVEGNQAPTSWATSASPSASPSAPAPAMAASTDAFVAEQVSYWITNDIQNAQMKLDGIGEKPVEVSITMNGNEAHIAFRTDEPQARDVLENASNHLKDMLQREGVVLSGVSVGTSGSGSNGSQERNPRQGARQAMVASSEPVARDPLARAPRVASLGLDLFV
jgi:flagellar hook-length control protein FliK